MLLPMPTKGRVRPSVSRPVRRSIRKSVPCYCRKTNTAVFKGGNSSYNFINNDAMSDDEEIVSYVPPPGPPQTFFDFQNASDQSDA